MRNGRTYFAAIESFIASLYSFLLLRIKFPPSFAIDPANTNGSSGEIQPLEFDLVVTKIFGPSIK